MSAQPAGAPAAAPAAPQVEVSSVKFNYERAGGGDSWLETTIELDVRPGGRQAAGEFLDRVRVALNLGCEATNPKGEKRNTFYRASVEILSVEGGKASVRFFLPPEIVKRDRLRGEPAHYLVELDVGGERLPPTQAKTSKSIGNATALKSFQDKVSAEAAANDGILMPQYFTPFANDPRRPSPTFFRREGQR